MAFETLYEKIGLTDQKDQEFRHTNIEGIKKYLSRVEDANNEENFMDLPSAITCLWETETQYEELPDELEERMQDAYQNAYELLDERDNLTAPEKEAKRKAAIRHMEPELEGIAYELEELESFEKTRYFE